MVQGNGWEGRPRWKRKSKLPVRCPRHRGGTFEAACIARVGQVHVERRGRASLGHVALIRVAVEEIGEGDRAVTRRRRSRGAGVRAGKGCGRGAAARPVRVERDVTKRVERGGLQATRALHVEREVDRRGVRIGDNRSAWGDDTGRERHVERFAERVRTNARDIVHEHGDAVAEGLVVAAALHTKDDLRAIGDGSEEVWLQVERAAPAVRDVERPGDAAAPRSQRARRDVRDEHAARDEHERVPTGSHADASTAARSTVRSTRTMRPPPSTRSPS